MIVKSMSRKEPTFSQLYNYIANGRSEADHKYDFYHNIYADKGEEIIREFDDNSKLFEYRKRGNYLYHEVVSITRTKNISTQEQKQIFMDIIHKYVTTRANGALVYGGLHDEKDSNLHYHLMISANNVGEAKKSYLTKQQFSKVKKDLEVYVLERYPQLEQAKLINKEKRTDKDKSKSGVKEKIESAIKESNSINELDENLKKHNIKRYIRGKTVGFTDLSSKKNSRLKTLGLDKIYSDLTGQPKQPFSKNSDDLNKDTANENASNDKVQLDENNKKGSNKEHSSDLETLSKQDQAREELKKHRASKTKSHEKDQGKSK